MMLNRFKKVTILVGLSVLFGLSACSKKKGSSTANRATAPAVRPPSQDKVTRGGDGRRRDGKKIVQEKGQGGKDDSAPVLSKEDLRSKFDKDPVDTEGSKSDGGGSHGGDDIFQPPIAHTKPSTDFGVKRDHYYQEGILTGAALDENRLFTDSLNDSVMKTLVGQMKLLDQEIKEDSYFLAERVTDIAVEFLEGNRVLVRVHLYEDNQLYRVELNGVAGGERIQLTQSNIDRAKGFHFKGTLNCLDSASSCSIRTLQLDQIRNHKVCKTVYAVSRAGNAHFVMSQGEYDEFYSGRECMIKNKAHKCFAHFLANTVLWNKICQKAPMNAYELGAEDPVYYADQLTLETWAVANGRAELKLKFIGNNHGIKDLVTFRGPLVTGNKTSDVRQALHISGYLSSEFDTGMVSLNEYIQAVSLTGNDGRGQFGLEITYKGTPAAKSSLEIQSLLEPSVRTPNFK